MSDLSSIDIHNLKVLAAQAADRRDWTLLRAAFRELAGRHSWDGTERPREGSLEDQTTLAYGCA